MTNRTGRYLGVDSACIAAIAREESYDAFRQEAQKLSEKEKEKIIQKFELEMDIENNPPWTKRETPNDELSYKMLCVVSTYGCGIESAMLKYFDLSKGFIFHLMTGKGRNDIKLRYANTPKEEIIKIGKKYFEEWELQSYSKNKIKEEYKDLVVHYGIADLKAP